MRQLYKVILFCITFSVFHSLMSLTSDLPQRPLVFGGDRDYPPYEYIDKQGNPAGFNIDLVNAIAHNLGIEVEFELDQWSRTLDNFYNNRFDVLTGINYSHERAKLYTFSRPHNHIEMVIVVRKDNKDIIDESHLINKQIIVQLDDIMHEYVVRNNITEKIVTVRDQSEALLLLSSGRHDAALLPRKQTLFLADLLGIENIKVLPVFLTSLEYCFATFPDNTSIISVLDRELLSMRESGEYKELYQKWFSQYDRQTISIELIIRYLLYILIPIVATIFIIILWSVSLKVRIKRATKELHSELEAHKNTLTELIESRNRYEYLIDNLPEIIFEASIEGNIIYINKNIESVFNYSPDQVVNKMNLEQLIVPSEKDDLNTFRSTLQNTKKNYMQFSGLRKDGKEISIIVYASIITNENNPYILGIIVDYSIQKRQFSMQKAIYEISEASQSAENINQLFSQVHNTISNFMEVKNFYIALYDSENDIISFPYFKAEVDIQPKPRKLIKGMTEYVLRTGKAILANKDIIQNLVEQGEVEEFGQWAEVWVGVPLILKGEAVGVIAVQDYYDKEAYDETDKQLLTYISEQTVSAIYRKKTEERSERQKIYFEELFMSMPAGLALVDNDDRVIDTNPAFLDMYGFKKEEVTGRYINELIVPKDLVKESQHFSLLTQEGSVIEKETIRKTKDNKILNVKVIGVPVKYEGKQEAVYGIYLDTTDLHKANKLLASEKDRLQVMLASIGDGVIATDNNGNVVLINSIACQLTGWTEDEAIGRQIEEVFTIMNESTRDDIESIVNKVIETESIIHLSNHTILKSKDGKEYIIEDSAAPIKDKEGYLNGVILVFRDSTEKSKLHDELQRTAKLESIGVLAGGIAHDFNNILTVIIGNLSLTRKLCEGQPSPKKINERLNEMEKALLRAKNITQQLLTYSTGGEPVRTTASVNELIQDTVDFVTHGSNVKTEIEIQEDIWNINADSGQISQVINNLTINALQAMPDGGKLYIRAYNEIFTAEAYQSLKPGKYVVIAFKDTGCGIPKTHLKNIFDPFFTTKSEGSGLGLTTSNNIIKKHQGFITVESVLGKGTTFTIYIPATELEVIDKKPIKCSLIKGKRILIMDDDEGLLDVVAEMLDTLGYIATTTKDGKEAIEEYKTKLEQKKPYDIVILDLTVPGGMGGKDTIKELLAIDPQVCCIVSSGYSSDPVMAEYRKHGFKAVLSKPYSFTELNKTLADFFSDL